MAWTTPVNVPAGTIYTQLWSEIVRDDLLYLKDRADNPPRAVAYHSTTQSVPNNADTLLALNSEYSDSAGLHDTATNNSRLTIPSGQGGYYLLTAFVDFAASATGQRGLQIRVNASFVTAYLTVDAAAAGVTRLTTAGVALMAAGDFADLVCYQNSGGALNVTADLFAAVRIA